MSVAMMLGVEDVDGPTMAEARQRWHAWTDDEPELAVVDDLLQLRDWTRTTEPEAKDLVLRSLARIGSESGSNDPTAITASLMLDMAVRDGRLSRNVAVGVNLPRPVKHERRYLTHAQVDALAQACGYPEQVSKHRAHDEITNEMYRLVVLFLAYTGVRFGEMAALRVKRIDLVRRRAVIAESVTPVQGLGMVWGTTKTHKRREAPMPRFLVEDLKRHLQGRDPDDLVFAGIRSGNPLRVSAFRKVFRPAAEAIGMPDLYPHELRHTAASLAIAAGADVKVVQQMLGHGSATMTLDTYGHLFGNRLDEVADAMDAAREMERGPAPKQDEENPGVAKLLPIGLADGSSPASPEGVSAGQATFSTVYPQRDSNVFLA